MFIARISRGRTIRQFVTGVLLVPSVVSLMWFAIFGGAAIDAAAGRRRHRRRGRHLEAQLFGAARRSIPLATVDDVLVMVLVAIFFVSGADAASIVMGTLSERGTLEPSRPRSIFWGVADRRGRRGHAAGRRRRDALTGLQNLTIIAALPFVLVMVGLAVALAKDLRSDPMVLRRSVRHRGGRAGRGRRGQHRHGDDFALVVAGNGHDEAGPRSRNRRNPGRGAAAETRGCEV